MKMLGKQILQGFLLGAVMPAMILGTMVGLEGSDDASSPSTPTAETMKLVPSVTESMRTFSETVTIPVMNASGTVDQMNLEEYLCRVVLAEMPANFEPEALKAQAVVARTYALRRNMAVSKHPHDAVCTDSACCQGYITETEYLDKGGHQSGINKIRQAVLSTVGQVLTYEGELIEATYFSCSGGITEDAAAVWGSDIPYLRSAESPGEESAVHYTDTVTFSKRDVESALGIELTGAPEDWFVPVSYTAGDGVAEMDVAGFRFTGVELRRLLNLRSTNFTVDAFEDCVTFTTYGYGHRVGMSQYGADAMALAGSSYDEILSHYYQGTTLTDYSYD